MKIILINHYAGNLEMGFEYRPYYLSREWVNLGHEVHIFAATYSHLRANNPIVSHDFETQIIDGITYHWVKTISYKGNGIKRAFTMFQFTIKLIFHAKRIAREIAPDAIITSSTYPLDTYAGQRIKKFSEKL